MGRKKNPNSVSTMYFGEFQEEKVREYLLEPEQHIRSQIYNEHLEYPLKKMVESIMNTYKLYSSRMPYQELFDDTLSFLHSKMFMFKPEKNKKAYSYYGTIIKRRLQNRKKDEDDDKKSTYLYEDTYEEFGNDTKLTYELEYVEPNPFDTFFKEVTEMLKDKSQSQNLSANDKKTVDGIILIMEEHSTIFEDKGLKYNKNQILQLLRDVTNLSTKEITIALKNIRISYQKFKKEKIDYLYRT